MFGRVSGLAPVRAYGRVHLFYVLGNPALTRHNKVRHSGGGAGKPSRLLLKTQWGPRGTAASARTVLLALHTHWYMFMMQGEHFLALWCSDIHSRHGV